MRNPRTIWSNLAVAILCALSAGCTAFTNPVADGIPDLGLVHARDITFALVSPAPQENLRRYAERGELTDLSTLREGEQVTVMAEVVKVTVRPMLCRWPW